jgi:exosortase C (VPDSG-CTERM-specific)
VSFAAGSSLYSHILLIPLVSGAFVWMRRADLPAGSVVGRKWAAAPVAMAIGLLAGYWFLRWRGVAMEEEDALAWIISAFYLFVVGSLLYTFGSAVLGRLLFPVGLLVFIIPFPVAVREGIEFLLQHTSAVVAHWFFALCGTPVYREGVFLQLPGQQLNVAPECSGMRSTLALFITSLVAAQLFLDATWKRTVLAILVVVLGIVRNAFRILVIGQLCLYYGPVMLDSYIHRRGGPIFFALSLVPLLLALWLLRRGSMRKRRQ